MKQHIPTLHRNYLVVEYRTTGRCTPFAPRHHGAVFPNPYAYPRNKVVYLFLYIKDWFNNQRRKVKQGLYEPGQYSGGSSEHQ